MRLSARRFPEIRRFTSPKLQAKTARRSHDPSSMPPLPAYEFETFCSPFG